MIKKICSTKESDIPLAPATLEARLRAQFMYLQEENIALKAQLYGYSAAKEAGRALSKRLGLMADAIVSAKVGPKARFFSRERVDEIILLLREAERLLERL